MNKVSDTDIATMDRKDLIAELMWNSGGTGFGICTVGNQLMWALDQPGPNKPDLPSIVAVSGKADEYTDDELRELVAFSRKQTARYDEMFGIRRGANLICVGKEPSGSWLRKRLSWECGPMYSKTLAEAVAIFDR